MRGEGRQQEAELETAAPAFGDPLSPAVWHTGTMNKGATRLQEITWSRQRVQLRSCVCMLVQIASTHLCVLALCKTDWLLMSRRSEETNDFPLVPEYISQYSL